MSAKKPQPHIKRQPVSDDLDLTPPSLSRQGRSMPLQAQASSQEAALPAERVAVPAQAAQKQPYSGVMSEALQRQQSSTQKRQTQSGPAIVGAAPYGPRASLSEAATARSASGVTGQHASSISSSATRPLSATTVSGQSRAAQPSTAQQRVAHEQPRSTNASQGRIDQILDQALDEDQRSRQRQSRAAEQTSAARPKPRPAPPQWYLYPVAGSNTSLLLGVAVCLFLGFVLLATPLGTPLGLYNSKNTFLTFFRGNAFKIGQEARQVVETVPGEHSILGKPTISAQEIDYVLREYGSPAAGQGKAFFELGQKYNIDPAYALAFFIHESSAGTNNGWAGLKPDGSSTHNVGNIICAGYKSCYNRFRDYASWEEGIEDWYRLLSVEYVEGRGTTTVEQIIPIYAPSFENNVPAYVNAVTSLVNEWRQRGVQ